MCVCGCASSQTFTFESIGLPLSSAFTFVMRGGWIILHTLINKNLHTHTHTFWGFIIMRLKRAFLPGSCIWCLCFGVCVCVYFFKIRVLNWQFSLPFNSKSLQPTWLVSVLPVEFFWSEDGDFVCSWNLSTTQFAKVFFFFLFWLI